MLILCITIAVTFLDQVTKHLVGLHLRLGEHIEVLPGYFNLAHVHNTGAAWGMLAGLNGWLILLSISMLVFLVGFHRSVLGEGSVNRWSVGLMLAGVIGNLVDRVRFGYVVDFLDFHWRGHHFPAFNVADSAICTGVGLFLLLHGLQAGKRDPQPPASADDAAA
jgi:signal peptidase II